MESAARARLTFRIGLDLLLVDVDIV